jgi:hypothetical protein
MNGTLIIKIKMGKGIFEEKEISSDIPVTPPSIN